MQKELIRSEDLYSRGWAICRLRAQGSRFQDSRLPCGARGVRESRKFCSRKQPERLLVTVLLFTNASDILGLLLLTRGLVHSFGHIGFVIALVIAFPVYLLLLSVLPKSLFRRFPFRALARLAGILEFISILF